MSNAISPLCLPETPVWRLNARTVNQLLEGLHRLAARFMVFYGKDQLPVLVAPLPGLRMF